MEMVFYCADCNKFFYGSADEEQICPHCQSNMVASTEASKFWYSMRSNAEKEEFKQQIRNEFTREFIQTIRQEQKEYEERKRARSQISALEKERNFNMFLMTTGYSFEGYVITEYIDVMFEEILVGLGLGKSFVSGIDNFLSAATGTEATTMMDKLNEVKDQLKTRLIRKAVENGANAMLGIDFESSKLGELIMVSMTGTAVKIEKIHK